MKDLAKQQARAVVDVAERVRKLIADIRPAVQQKYGLTNELVNLAAYVGLASVAIECGKSIEGMEPMELSDVLAIIPTTPSDSGGILVDRI
jgi:hypothetical protein